MNKGTNVKYSGPTENGLVHGFHYIIHHMDPIEMGAIRKALILDPEERNKAGQKVARWAYVSNLEEVGGGCKCSTCHA